MPSFSKPALRVAVKVEKKSAVSIWPASPLKNPSCRNEEKACVKKLPPITPSAAAPVSTSTVLNPLILKKILLAILENFCSTSIPSPGPAGLWNTSIIGPNERPVFAAFAMLIPIVFRPSPVNHK